MKKGFTLAEVLITLAIIGVVAALTIPVVMHKYQQRVYYSQFMKSYNTLMSAYQLSVAENGTPNNWGFDGSDYKGFFEKYFGNYFKTSSYCSDDPSSCGFGDDTRLKYLNASSELLELIESSGSEDYAEIIGGMQSYLLQDGSVVALSFDEDDDKGIEYHDAFEIFVDTNGAKAPNIIGRDVFHFEIESPSYKLVPTGAQNQGEYGYSWYDEDDHIWYYEGDDNPGSNCSTSKNSIGLGCAGRLIRDGKMDY